MDNYDVFENEETVYNSQPIENNNYGLLGFIFSLVGFLTCCFYGGIFGIVGVVFSAKQLKKKSDSFAIAGLILGILAIIGLAILTVGMINMLKNPDEIIKQFEDLMSTTDQYM